MTKEAATAAAKELREKNLIADTDKLITAFAKMEPCGPMFWLILRNKNGDLREVGFHEEDFSEGMKFMFSSSAAMQKTLTAGFSGKLRIQAGA